MISSSFILFHTDMRISEFCGLTVKDIDLESKTVNIDHQLQRNSDMSYHIETPKTNAGVRRIPITDEVADSFARILEDRKARIRFPASGSSKQFKQNTDNTGPGRDAGAFFYCYFSENNTNIRCVSCARTVEK